MRPSAALERGLIMCPKGIVYVNRDIRPSAWRNGGDGNGLMTTIPDVVSGLRRTMDVSVKRCYRIDE
jgi:hypothetical protein